MIKTIHRFLGGLMTQFTEIHNATCLSTYLVGINVPCCWKQVAQRWKNSKAKFLFRERAFHFRDRTVVWPSVARSDSPDRVKGKFDRGNGKLSRGKEEPERFSSEEHSIFQQHGYIFSASKASWPQPQVYWILYPSFMDAPRLDVIYGYPNPTRVL